MKPWHQKIQRHIQDWSTRLGDRNWWPHNVYHFTDVQNAASILETGFIYSRNEVQQLGIMINDNASQKVIQKTSDDHLRFVRLYFRPRTPTQYRNEGIRPIGKRALDAHCPVPIYFVFDAIKVLTKDETGFSTGNMASNKAVFSGEEWCFDLIPFNLVFHDAPIFPPENVPDIVFRRCAEILVPDHLQLEDYLVSIICRSSAEKKTLLSLLSEPIREKWENKIKTSDKKFFFRKWAYVEEVVVVEGNKIIFRFNPDNSLTGPYTIRFEYLDYETGKNYSWQGTEDKLDGNLTITFSHNPKHGMVSLFIENDLAFRGVEYFEELPF